MGVTAPVHRASLLFVFAWAYALVACAPAVTAPPKTVSLRLRGAPEDANVVLDDVLIGPLAVVAARGVGLPPGKHTLSVEAEGYFPFDRVLDVPRGRTEPLALDVVLTPLPE